MDRLRPALRVSALLASGLLSCAGASPVTPSSETTGPRKAATPRDPQGDRYTWEAWTRSPQPLADEPDEPPCGASDRALRRVAERIAAREVVGKPPLDTAEISFALRSEGAPYVWPRAWTLAGAFDGATERSKVDEWLRSPGDEGIARCAVATVRARDGRQALAVVAVSVLADLEPLPTRVTVGTWLDLRAVLHVPAPRVEVIVLGPRGRPHAVVASLTGANVRARFRADREGTWLVQVVATTSKGPRVAAEALVAAGSDPPETLAYGSAPGEKLARSTAGPTDNVFSMVNGARSSEGLAALQRDEALDHVALEQAEAMRGTKTLSHGANGESLDERLAALNLRSAGENVAHATDLARAHRSLWRSPSHRENLLHPAFELVGIGVAPDDDGTVWVCEIFAARHPSQ